MRAVFTIFDLESGRGCNAGKSAADDQDALC
jgi:hypothetical protein